MKRLIEKIVLSGFVTCWRRAGAPTSRWPSFVNATTDGVVRPPSAFGMTVGSPPSSTAMQLLVVPRSIPIVFAIPLVASVGVLRKSKPDNIKSLGKRKAFFGLLAASLLVLAGQAQARPAPPRLVRISSDATATEGAQHATELEPDAVAVGSKIVATFQVGRYFGGGSGAIGFSTSSDAGRTWRPGLLPQLTQASAPPGAAAFASDPSVAYDALHHRWLIATLSGFAGQSGLFVSGSADGLVWDAPAVAITYPQNPVVGISVDKEWIACDNSRFSPLRGRCYLAYTDIAHDADPLHPGSHRAAQSPTAGSLTWSAPALWPVSADTDEPSAQP